MAGRRPTDVVTVADNTCTKEDEQVAQHIILYAEGATDFIIGLGAVIKLPVPLPERSRHRRRRRHRHRKTVTMTTSARTVNKTLQPTSQTDQDVAGTVVDSVVVIVNKLIKSTNPTNTSPNRTSPMIRATYFLSIRIMQKLRTALRLQGTNNASFTIDFEASGNIIDESTFSSFANRPKLKKAKTNIYTYGASTPVHIIGAFEAEAETNNKITVGTLLSLRETVVLS